MVSETLFGTMRRFCEFQFAQKVPLCFLIGAFLEKSARLLFRQFGPKKPFTPDDIFG